MNKLIPLKEKAHCSNIKDSFLYYFPSKNTYIFDNHRLSLWCWLNFIKQDEYEKKYNLVYIDKHIDCRCTDFDERYKKFLKKKDDFKELKKFRETPHIIDSVAGDLPVIDWGNFLAFAIKLEFFKNIFIFTKEEYIDQYFKRETTYCTSEKFDLKNVHSFNSNIKDNLTEIFKGNSNVILDIDLDFFVIKNEKEEYLINKKSINQCLVVIKKYLDKIELIAIALSPDYCDGWENSEDILSYFTKMLNIDLKIPLELD